MSQSNTYIKTSIAGTPVDPTSPGGVLIDASELVDTYQLLNQKGVANGYASLDAGATVPDTQIPAGIARDSEVSSAITTHESAPDPHSGYQLESEKGVANGYASLGANARLPDAQTNRKHYIGSGTPGVNDDSSQGYGIGSCWYDTSSLRVYTCLDASVGAAHWDEVTLDPTLAGIGRLAPGIHHLGSIMNYPAAGAGTASAIQYARRWIPAGVTLNYAETFVDSLGALTRYVRIGVYSQVDPTEQDWTTANGKPLTKIVETAPFDTNLVGYKRVSLSTPTTITVTGNYWIAMIVDNAVVKLAISQIFRAGQLPVYFETGTGTTLPATVGTITAPASAVAYAAVVE